jgi:hypothetical protein
MSLVGRQSVPAAVTLDILQNRLTQVLRHERGLSYGVKAAREQLDGDLVHAWLEADALPEQTSMVAHTTLAAFESLAETGSIDGEVEDYARRLQSGYEAPAGPMMVLQRHAENILSGRPTRTPAETLRLVSEVDTNAVSEVARGFLGNLVVATPQLVPAVQGRMRPLAAWSAQTIAGAEVSSLDRDVMLTVGDQGVMLTAGAGQHVTVRSGAVAALLRWNDRKRTLIGTDGFVLQLDQADWPGGDAVLRSIDERVDPSLMVDIDSPGPYRRGRDPQGQDRPADGPQAVARAATPKKAARQKVAPLLRWRWRIFRVLWSVLVIFGVLAMIGGDIGGGASFAAIGLIALAAHELLVRRKLRQLRAPSQ